MQVLVINLFYIQANKLYCKKLEAEGGDNIKIY